MIHSWQGLPGKGVPVSRRIRRVASLVTRGDEGRVEVVIIRSGTLDGMGGRGAVGFAMLKTLPRGDWSWKWPFVEVGSPRMDWTRSIAGVVC